MKKLSLFLICFLLLSHVTLFPQMRGGNRQVNSNKQGQKKQEASKLSIDKMAPFFFYDAGEVIHSLKINEATKRLAIITELDKYNNKLIEVKAFNRETLYTAQVFLKSKYAESARIGDSVIIDVANVKLKKMLAPVNEKLLTQKLLLNQTFKKTFTEKQYSKWLKYQKSKTHIKRKLSQQNRPKLKGPRKGKGRQNF